MTLTAAAQKHLQDHVISLLLQEGPLPAEAIVVTHYPDYHPDIPRAKLSRAVRSTLAEMVKVGTLQRQAYDSRYILAPKWRAA